MIKKVKHNFVRCNTSFKSLLYSIELLKYCTNKMVLVLLAELDVVGLSIEYFDPESTFLNPCLLRKSSDFHAT